MPFFEEFRQKRKNHQFTIEEEEQSDEEYIVSATSPNWGPYLFPIRFAATLGQSQPGDSSLIWSLVPPSSFNGSADLGLKFEKQYIVMANVATSSSYPTNIYIAIDNFPGLCDVNGNVTGRVIKYAIMNITNNQTTPPTSNIVYGSRQIPWVLLKSMKLLNFRVFFDDNTTPQTTPLPFQISFECSIMPTPFDKRFESDFQGLDQQNEFFKKGSCVFEMIYDDF